MTGPEIADYCTAGATVALACATVWLGFKTKAVVQANGGEVLQGQQLLKDATRQANSAEVSAKATGEQADITSRMFLENNRPFVTPDPDSEISIQALESDI